MWPDIGLNLVPTFLAMVLLAIPPILVNAYAGLREVDRDLLEAGRAMGLREVEVLRTLELPLAAPVIIGGFRTAVLNVIATATIGAVVGFGGLGRFILDGRLKGVAGLGELIGGAILVSVLAISVDLLLSVAQRGAARRADRTIRPARGFRELAEGRAFTRRSLTGPPATPLASVMGYARPAPRLGRHDTHRGGDPMRFSRALALGAAMLVAVAACSSGGGSSPSTAPTQAPAESMAPESMAPETPTPTEAPKPDVRIGSDGFYESQLVAEMFAQVLEADGYPVTRTLGIGARQVRQPALENGQIDVSPEYVGSGLGYYDTSQITGDGLANRDALAAQLTAKGISVFGISPGEDTNAAVVRQDTATELGLATMSDLAAVQGQLRWGLPPDCDANPLCKGALEAYGIDYPPKKRESLAACDAPIAQALQNKGVDFAWLCSTRGRRLETTQTSRPRT